LTRLLGIDLGTRRIGLAIADTANAGVRPLATLRRSTAERERQALATVLNEQRVDEVVVGLPLNMDGTEGEQARLTRDWAADVLAPLSCAVSWRDERLTSERASRRLGAPRRGRAGGPPTAGQRSAHRSAIDRQAAALILEAELAARGATGEASSEPAADALPPMVGR
jgi:putative holliday junction resolvase